MPLEDPRMPTDTHAALLRRGHASLGLQAGEVAWSGHRSLVPWNGIKVLGSIVVIVIVLGLLVVEVASR